MGESGMRVLVTNDDGPVMEWLLPLAEAAEKKGAQARIWVPDRNRSSRSKASVYGDVGIREGVLGGRPVMLVSGYPADAVQCGLSLDGEFDAVLSGVNDSPNLGAGPVLTSGTVGAALEAALGGVPSLAVSAHPDADPALAAEEGCRFLGKEGVWNINVPPRPTGRILCPLRLPSPSLRVRARTGDGTAEISQRYLDWDNPGGRGDDAWYFSQGLVTVTPLSVDLTNRSAGLGDGEFPRRLGEEPISR